MIENPNEKQLRTLEGLIYLIHNNINEKDYIGRAKNRFCDRYSACKWWHFTHNTYLKKAANRYGIENFTITILEYGILDFNKLKEIESEYIKKYDCLFPKGYNFLEEIEDGKEFTQEMRLNMAIAHCKKDKYMIKEIATGEIKEFRCPKEIKEKYNIFDQNLHALFKGELRTIKGICLPETNPDKFRNKQKLIHLLDQYGNNYEFYNCSIFSKKQKCNHTSLCKLINRTAFAVISENRTIFRNPETQLNDRQYLVATGKFNPNQKYKSIILTNIKTMMDFFIEIPNGIGNFCVKHNFPKRCIYELASGHQQKSHGFKLKEVILL